MDTRISTIAIENVPMYQFTNVAINVCKDVVCGRDIVTSVRSARMKNFLSGG